MIAPLLLERLEPGTRVRADGDVIYVTEDVEIPDGAEGTVVQPWGVGASHIRWDVAPDHVLATAHDAIARVVGVGDPRCECREADGAPTCGRPATHRIPSAYGGAHYYCRVCAGFRVGAAERADGTGTDTLERGECCAAAASMSAATVKR